MGFHLSIITPTLNRPSKLINNLNNLLDQNYKNFEWVIVMEEEDEQTIKVVNDMKKNHFFIKSVIGKYKSIEKAFNAGIEAASGKFVLLKPDDDFLTNSALKIFDNFSKNNNNKWFIGLGEYCNDKRKLFILVKKFLIRNYNFSNLIIINFIMTPSVFVLKELLNFHGNLDEKFGHGSDYQLWLKIGNIDEPYIIKENLSCATIDTTTQTGQFELDKYLRLLKEVKKYNKKKSIFIFSLQNLSAYIVISFNYCRKLSNLVIKYFSFKSNFR